MIRSQQSALLIEYTGSGRDIMAKRKDEREEEQDQGTKAELGGGDDSEWLKDPKANSAVKTIPLG